MMSLFAALRSCNIEPDGGRVCGRATLQKTSDTARQMNDLARFRRMAENSKLQGMGILTGTQF